MSTGSDGDGDCYSFLDYTDKPILQNFSCLSLNLKIANTKYVQILNYFLKNPGKTTQEVVDEASSLEELKNYDYNTIRRYVNYLLDDLKLIEIEKKEFIEFGNLDVKRDFGFSKKYVEAMWLMLQQEKPDDFVICSGQSVYLHDVVKYVFKKVGIPESAIRISKAYFRPTDIVDIYGSSEKAHRLLGWDYNTDFFGILDILIEEERINYGR